MTLQRGASHEHRLACCTLCLPTLQSAVSYGHFDSHLKDGSELNMKCILQQHYQISNCLQTYRGHNLNHNGKGLDTLSSYSVLHNNICFFMFKCQPSSSLLPAWILSCHKHTLLIPPEDLSRAWMRGLSHWCRSQDKSESTWTSSFFFLSLHFLKRHCVRSGIFCDSVALQYMYMYTCFWLWLHYLWGGMVVQWLAPGIDSHSAAFLHQHPLRLCHDVCRIIMNPPRFS